MGRARAVGVGDDPVCGFERNVTPQGAADRPLTGVVGVFLVSAIAQTEGFPPSMVRLAAWLFGEAAQPSPPPALAQMEDLLRPVFEAEDEAALLAALDQCAPRLLKLVAQLPRSDDGSRDTFVRARLTAGLDEADAERVAATFAMFLVCRDASQVLQQIEGSPAVKMEVLLAEVPQWSERERQGIQRALRGSAAFLAVGLAAASRRTLAPWHRSAMIAHAFETARRGAAGVLHDLSQVGAIPTLVAILRRHGVVALAKRLHDAVLDVLDERLSTETTRRAALSSLRERLDVDDELPLYVGDHFALFEEVMPLAAERALAEGGEAWLHGDPTAEETLRSMGMLSVDLMAVLDANDAGRPVSEMRLDDARRDDILARLRADRLARAGAPRMRTDLVIRDVIASQRIEGVDARAIVFEGAPAGRE